MSKKAPAVPIPASSRNILIAGVLLALATLAAYHNSFFGPFVYDDLPAIRDNLTIRHLGDLGTALSPPNDSGITVNGRPFLNLSLALNYAFGGANVVGYHLVNLAIHLCAGLALFGLIRRTLLLPGLRERFARDDFSLPLAFCAALLWTVHPLQTSSVSYMIQRAESLAGLFFLLTFYCFLRAATAPGNRLWPALMVLSCLCGMGSKEIMASAPLLVLLYDRAIVSGTFRAAWQRHSRLYFGLAATWIFLGWELHLSGNRGGTAGFGANEISSWDYALTSALAIGKYVKLSFWPHPLIFDYGSSVQKHLWPVLPQALLILSALAGTFYALWRHPLLGFVGLWFFCILGPSSSIIPVASETITEHRMYLPLAAIVVLTVVGLGLRFGRSLIPVFLALGAVAIGLTIHRNHLYSEEILLWGDAAEKYPSNERAHNNLGEIFFRQGKFDEAIARFKEAVRLQPAYVDALNNLGNILTQRGDALGALEPLQLALRLEPQSAPTHNNLGDTFYHLGRKDEAVRLYREAIRLKPDYPDAYNNLGVVLGELGRNPEAIESYQRALGLRPDYLDAHYNYANALSQSGRAAEAIAQFEAALRLKPTHAQSHNNLGIILYGLGKTEEARAHYEIAVHEKENYPEAQNNLGVALFDLGRPAEALTHFSLALRYQPDYADARKNLAEVHNAMGAQNAKSGLFDAARPHLEEALRLNPAHVGAHFNLAVVFSNTGQPAQAIFHLEEALRLKPDYAEAQAALAQLRNHPEAAPRP